MVKRAIAVTGVVIVLLLAGGIQGGTTLFAQTSSEVSSGAAHKTVINRYCVTCHNERRQTAGLMLDAADIENAYRYLRSKYGLKFRIGDFFSWLAGKS